MTRPRYANPSARSWRCTGAPAEVRRFHAGLPGYAPSRLVEIPALAAELGVGRVFVKDESARFGLPAFKVLGASWAVVRALSTRLGAAEVVVDLAELRARLAAAPPRLVAATDGNHGRAVARMAALLGLSAAVFVPTGLTPTAVAAIAAEGAHVETVDGGYDDAVAAAAAAASGDAAELVQDSGWPGYERVPGWIAEGYATLFAETDEQLAAAGAGAASLVSVPVGVGSLAQAAVRHYRGATAAPTVLSVEPTVAACVLASLTAGTPTTVPTGATSMAGLNCGTPSSVAWPYLRDGVDAAVAVTDPESAQAVHDLTAAGVPAGPCGGASLAGARAALSDPDQRETLNLPPDAVVVLVSTEGIEANPLPG